MKKITIQMLSALAISGTLTLPSVKADDESGINFTANIVAVCTLEAPSLVAFDDIPITAFSGQSVGQYLYDYSQSFSISTDCTGTSGYTLTFTPSSVANTCVGTDNTAMRVCIKMPDETALNFASGTATYTGTSSSQTLEMTAYPQVGATSVTTGEVTASVTVMIEPV